MTIRPLESRDATGAVACWRSVDEPNVLGVEAFLDETSHAVCALVVEESESIAGFAWLRPAWWYGPRMLSLVFIVHRERWRQGIGNQLWAALAERMREQADHWDKLFVDLQQNLEPARRFARQRGFHPTGTVVLESRLHVGEANITRLEQAELRLEQEGVSMAKIEARHLEDGAFVTRLYDCMNETERTSPASQPVQSRPFKEWRGHLLHGLESGHEVLWAAFENEVVVGTASLEVLDTERLENGFTGVRVASRGRGIASALKAQTIRWASTHGYRWIVTGSEKGNDPMLHINERIGYRRLPAVEEWAGTLPPT